jgi:hypothetical protein
MVQKSASLFGFHGRVDVPFGQVGISGDPALGFAGYLLNAFGVSNQPCWSHCAGGDYHFDVGGPLRNSPLQHDQIVIVSVTLAALIFFVFGGIPRFLDAARPISFPSSNLPKGAAAGRGTWQPCSTPPR